LSWKNSKAKKNNYLQKGEQHHVNPFYGKTEEKQDLETEKHSGELFYLKKIQDFLQSSRKAN